MMNKPVKKKLFICVAGLVAAFAVSGAVITAAKPVLANDASISFDEFETVYSVGDTLEIPETAAIKYKDVLYPAENCYLVRPDGGAVAGRSFTLDTVGEYTLIFEATANGRKISASRTFKTLKEYYTLSNDSSTVSYGELNGTYKKKGMKNGIVAELTEGATITFSEPVDVYADKTVELFTFNLVRMDCDVNYLTIRLTDCYNPDIEIDIQYWKRINMETYMKAGPKGSGLVGLSTDANGQYSIAGENYSRGIFGTPTRGNRPMNGNYNNITMLFENAEDGKIRLWCNTPEHESNPNGDTRLITEINNDKLYGGVFPGFTTGEVIVSITSTGFNNVQTARVEVGKFNGKTNEELDTFGAYNETVAPVIKVAADETDNKIIAGTKVKVPEAEALDASGIRGKVDYTVWYNYTDENSKRAINVENGKFFAGKMGTYTVEYRAEDVYGNRATRTFDLLAIKEGTPGISFNATTKYTDAEIGSSINLSGYGVTSLCKNYDVTVLLTDPKGNTADVTSSAASVAVSEVGTYTVEYLYSDTYYDGAYSYTFDCIPSNKAVFEKKSIPVPEYFVEGAKYSVEEINAYVYGNDGKVASALKSYVSYDGGEYREIPSDGFNVEKASKLRLKLAVEGDETNYIESAEADVINVGFGTIKLDVAKYFVGDFTGEAKNDYTTFTSGKNGDASMKFINPLLVSRFSLSFYMDADATLDGMDIVLTDYYDRAKTAVISFNDGEGSAASVAVNGAASAIASSWKGRNFVVSCDGSYVYFDGSATGANFGFSSDMCLLDVRFRSVKKGFSFNLAALCNQPYGKQVTDDARPMVSASLPPIVTSVNDVYVTEIPKFADVLSPSANKCTLTVNLTKFGEEEVNAFVDETGRELVNLPANRRYTIKFTEFGCYTFTYTYKDGAGKQGLLQQLVYVYDLTAPSIRFKNEPESTVAVSVGKAIKPLEVIVEDNVTKTENLIIWAVVYDERDRFIAATRGTFVLKEKGRYTVYVHCKDESGNASSVKYEVYAG